jgi:hypothetical protein
MNLDRHGISFTVHLQDKTQLATQAWAHGMSLSNYIRSRLGLPLLKEMQKEELFSKIFKTKQ